MSIGLQSALMFAMSGILRRSLVRSIPSLERFCLDSARLDGSEHSF